MNIWREEPLGLGRFQGLDRTTTEKEKEIPSGVIYASYLAAFDILEYHLFLNFVYTDSTPVT